MSGDDILRNEGRRGSPPAGGGAGLNSISTLKASIDSSKREEGSDSQDSFRLGRLEEALSGGLGADQERIAREGLQWLVMILEKNRDYGSGVWNLPVLAPNCDIAEAIFVRMSDKVSRIASLRKCPNENPSVDETIDETIGDLGAYCLLYLARPRILKEKIQ